jgi:hypothetical protein
MATAAAAIAADRVTVRSALFMSSTVGRSAGILLGDRCEVL